MPHLLVVLQTHSKGDSQHDLGLHDMQRYCGAPKAEVMRRCVLSLIESLNIALTTLSELTVELQVFDDHSDVAAIKDLQYALSKAQFKTELTHLDTYGIMPSIMKCYQHGHDHGQEWVYFAQDDYLYSADAIRTMLLSIHEFSRNLNAPASIYPFDDPYKYEPVNTVIQSHLVWSQGRHWKTFIHTASCFMTHISVIRDNWDLFHKMGSLPVSGTMEDESINRLFSMRGYYLFVPLPSLALHMQYSTEQDKAINWREWWDRFPKAEKTDRFPGATILNAGCGASTIKDAIFANDLQDYKEVRLDIDNTYNPDIVADITDLSGIDATSFDVVYTSHIIEHLDFYKVMPTIKDLLRITKLGGFVRIVVPNLKSIANDLAKGNLLDPVYLSPSGPISPIDILFGYRASIQRHNEFMRHKCGFTKESFEKMFAEAGIEDYTVQEIGFDLLVNINK